MQIYGDVLTVGCKVVAIFVSGLHLSHKITRNPRKTRSVYVSKAKTNPTIVSRRKNQYNYTVDYL